MLKRERKKKIIIKKNLSNVLSGKLLGDSHGGAVEFLGEIRAESTTLDTVL